MEIDILISFTLASAALAIAPGPDNIYVLIQSVANGKWYGLATVLGLISGCLVHTTLVAFGVSVIIKESDFVFTVIKVLGAAYMLYLAYKVFKSDAAVLITDNNVPKKGWLQLVKQGFIMNVLNPKVSLFFLAFFPGFLFSQSMSAVQQFYILGGLFMGVSLVIFSLIAILSAIIANYLKQHKNVGVVLKWLQIIVFTGIAVFILFSEK